MTVIDTTVEHQAWPSSTVGTSAIEVAPLTATIGAELSNISLAEASRDDDLFAELRSLLLKYKVLFFRDQDITRAEHVALAERFGPWRTTRSSAATPTTPAWPASTRTSTASPSTTRTPSTATPPGARCRPSARCSAASRVPPSAATPSG